ncbi:IQ-domain 28 [Rhynchospora pubera]|uniref:IQ-domain 28 n=1 Tax=Rhynchospora pubera TaxID=906938 RepID=A0AAV8F776_9POAL|nr:IQ-domain 28 [Rhynchospora pubera]
MGKSPAKWIKTVLFGKKSSRSNSTKKAANEKVNTGGKGPAFTETSPVISDPVLVTAHSNGAPNPAGTKEENSGTRADVPVSPLATQELDTQRVVELDTSENLEEKIREEKAAVTAQAAFRGYLARRAFKALKGIIRLQALIRGHLVRRQAVVSLRTMYAIVRFQALVRGYRVRHIGNGLVTCTKLQFTKSCSDTWREYASANAFAQKLLSYNIKVEPLHFQYDEQDPNSVLAWLSLWTGVKPWKPACQPKKTTDAKPVTRKSSYAMETESGKLKRNARRNPANANNESSQTTAGMNSTRNSKKFSSLPSESAQESSPLTELEKVKRNLRKVSSSVQDSSADIEAERTSISVPGTNNLDLTNGNHIEKAKKHSAGALTCTLPEIKPKRDAVVPTEIQTKKEREATEIIQNEGMSEIEGQIDNLMEAIASPAEEKPLEEVTVSKEETLSNENCKTTKRRSSLSIKPEYTDSNNILVQNNSPTVPSYMAMTQSAKTKLRGQASPQSGSDQGSAEKNGSTRRHSLPTSTNNGKLSSHSPRTQRPIHAKGAAKNDKSMHSSRDGTDRPIVEWRR